jgi:hypothetical protein
MVPAAKLQITLLHEIKGFTAPFVGVADYLFTTALRYAIMMSEVASMAQTTITTTAYEFSHGKRPAGRGYWGFFFNPGDRLSAVSDSADLWWATGASTFGEARRQALAEARRRGYQGDIAVAP